MIQSPFEADRSLTASERQAEKTLPRPNWSAMSEEPKVDYRVHPASRLWLRGPWEMAATIIIAIGVMMLMQPFVLGLYTYSFIVTLIGTVMFIVVSHFPE